MDNQANSLFMRLTELLKQSCNEGKGSLIGSTAPKGLSFQQMDNAH